MPASDLRANARSTGHAQVGQHVQTRNDHPRRNHDACTPSPIRPAATVDASLPLVAGGTAFSGRTRIGDPASHRRFSETKSPRRRNPDLVYPRSRSPRRGQNGGGEGSDAKRAGPGRQEPESRGPLANRYRCRPHRDQQKGPVPTAAGIPPRKELAPVIAKSRALGNRIVELDARLALAKIEMKSAQTAEGRGHLTAIEADAEARGYLFVARKAAIARG